MSGSMRQIADSDTDSDIRVSSLHSIFMRLRVPLAYEQPQRIIVRSGGWSGLF